MRRPRAAAACLVLTAFLATGCGQEAQQDADLDGPATGTATGPVTADPSPAGPTTTAGAVADRTPTVAAPAGLAPDQQAAVDAYTAYVVAVDALARTNDLEGSGVLEVTTGLIQDGVRTYTQESLQVGRTSNGPPLQVRIDAVDVRGDTATMPVCFDQSSWVDVVGGVATPVAPLLAFDVTVTRGGDRWLVSSVADADAARCTG